MFRTSITIFATMFLTGCLDSGNLDQAESSSTTISSISTTVQQNINQSTSSPNPCVPGQITAIDQNNVAQNFSSVQAAVNGASPGSTISVGTGQYNEIVNVTSKTGLNIRSDCRRRPVINGFALSGSSSITVSGFIIDAKTSNADGINLSGGALSNNNVTITNNEIKNAQGLFNGITVNDLNLNIQIVANYFHDNNQNGIDFFENKGDVGKDQSSGPYTVAQNVIHLSGQNGIMVDGKSQVVATINDNVIITNGKGTNKNGYGLNVSDKANKKIPANLTLTNNVIAYNNGTASSSKSTTDVFGLKDIVDSTDSGNLSSSGAEGSGFAQLVDSTAPALTLDVIDGIYTNNKTYQIPTAIIDVSPLVTKAVQNGNQILSTNLFYFTATATLSEGNNAFTFTSTDASGNVGTAHLNQIILDTIPPVITIGASDHVITNNPTFTIPVTITDASPTITKLYQNGVLVQENITSQPSFQVTLAEGVNTFEVDCVDVATNQAVPQKLTDIVLDTVPPVLSGFSPADGEMIDAFNFAASGVSNEPLASVTLNGINVALSQDKKSFSAPYSVTTNGPITFHWVATDLAGNSASFDVNAQIAIKVFYGNLISVQPDPASSNRGLVVVGAAGAARPGTTVTVKSGLFFNSGSAVANADGSFVIRVSFFDQATVSAFNSAAGSNQILTINYVSSTQLSGVVKDTDGFPLSGADVSVQGNGGHVLSDGNGLFTITDLKATGDQTLVIDGTAIPQSITGISRKFSITKVAINIGLSQNNVLPNPIYMAPLITDGTETQVASGGGASVTSSHAPGVQIDIPAGVTTFPDGTNGGKINISIVPGDKTTVPTLKMAKPDSVVSLEPSGLKFSQPVPLTLPNENNLPEGVQMVILSHNSAKGIWEIDGQAQVQGGSVVTLPGMGISHFSEVYAVPLGPVISQVNNPELSGADTFNGSLATSITLPSYKVLGSDMAPSLTYKSAWAKPTTVVSTYFDIPPQTVTFQRDFTTQTFYGIDSSYCIGTCYTSYHAYLIASRTQQIVTSWYEPDLITGQFFIGGIATQPGSPASPSATVYFKGPPAQSVISYAVELKDPSTGQYLESGLYPSAARYQIKLAHMVINSVTTTTNTEGQNNTQITAGDNTPQRTLIDQTFPQDLNVNLYVQNETHSPAGQGWRINGVQKIVNPQGGRIMLEEEDGSIATYSLANNIATVLDANNSNIDLNQGVDLTTWPSAVVTSYDDSQVQTSLIGVDLSSNSQSSVGSMQNYSGAIGYDDPPFFLWFATQELPGPPVFGSKPLVYWPKWNRQHYSYNAKSKTSQIVRVGDGTIYGTDSLNARLFQIAGGTYTHLAGLRTSGNPHTFGNSYGGMQNYCENNFGRDCQSVSTQPCGYIWLFPWNQYYCNPALGVLGDCNNCGNTSWPDPSAGNNFTLGGYQTFTGDGQGPDIAVNNPMGITTGPGVQIVFADTGNNMVRGYNVDTQAVVTLAGNGQNLDNGDGGQATAASMFHPRGVVYDAVGNLYVSTETGYIRKIESNGNISTIAGLPLEQGGVLANEGAALRMALNRPYGMIIDSVNNFLYIADTGNHRVLQQDLNTNYMKVVAGNSTCTQGNDGDGGAALNASLCSPTIVGLDDNRNLVVVDSGHNKIRRVIFSNTGNNVIAFSPMNKDLSTLVKNADGTFTRTYRNGRQVSFTAQGYEYAARDRIGNQRSFQYDSNGNLLSRTEPTGQVTTYSYSGSQLSSITDPAGRTTQFNYSGNFLSQVSFPDGSTKSFQYGSDGLMSGEVNQRGLLTQYVYNQYNRLQSVTRADGSQISVNDSASATVGNSYTADGPGQLQPFGSQQGQMFDGITDARNIQTKYVKDYQGFVTQIVDAQGNTTTITRDVVGKPTLIQRPDGSNVSFAYDPNTQDLLSTSDSATGSTSSATYDPFGNLVTRTDGRGFTSLNVFDPITGLQTASQVPGGITTSFTYTTFGKVASVSQPIDGSNSKVSSFQYDSFGNPVDAIDGTGRETIRQFDAAGNVTKIFNKQGGVVSSTYEYTYDGFNRLLTAKTPDGKVTTYSYFPTGELKAVLNPAGGTTQYAYDNLGRVTTITDPLGFVTSYLYDANGNVVQQTDPNGNVKTFAYDNLNRQVQAQFPDDLFQYAYDVRGNLTLAKNNESEIDLVRDVKGNVLSQNTFGLGAYTGLPNVTLSYQYDPNNNRLSMTDSMGGTQSYNYDPLNRLTSLTNMKGENYSFTYDNANRLTGISRPGISSSFAFDGADFVTSIIHSNGSSNVSSFSYQYDGSGNRTSMQTLAGTSSYSYDINSQLVASTSPTVPNETFSYDQLSNRTSDSGGSFNYDNKLQRITDDYKHTYVHDNNGNLTSKLPKVSTDEAFQFTYSSQNQLMDIKVYDGMPSPMIFGPLKREISFVYDALGRRIHKAVLDSAAPSDPLKTYARSYIYDGQEILSEYDGSNNLLARYTHSSLRTDDVLAVDVTSSGAGAHLAQTAGTYTYLKDAQGSVISVGDAFGNVVQNYNYSAFGSIVSITDSGNANITTNPVIRTSFTFTGREYDKEANLYYYRARYYDSSTGRFLQTDPNAGRLRLPSSVVNSYMYVGNSPANYTDPAGEFPVIILVAIAVGLVVGTTNAIEVSKVPGVTGWQVFGSFAIGAAAGVASVAASTLGVPLALALQPIISGGKNFFTQTIVYGRVNDWSYVAVSAGSGLIGAAGGYALTGFANEIGFVDKVSAKLGAALGASLKSANDPKLPNGDADSSIYLQYRSQE